MIRNVISQIVIANVNDSDWLSNFATETLVLTWTKVRLYAHNFFSTSVYDCRLTEI